MYATGTFYSHAALGMATLIKSSYPSSVSHVDLYTSLGEQEVVVKCVSDYDFVGSCFALLKFFLPYALFFSLSINTQ